MKNVLKLFVFFSILFVGSVSASNDVDYHLTITKDYNFNETINFSLTDYKSVNGGNNPFFLIVEEPVYTDISYQNKYNKKVSTSGNKKIVKLSNTYSEYGMGNANYLNNCFENANYDYNIDSINFSGSDFICTDADKLTISVTTDFEVTNHNADNISGNTYSWNVSDNNFTMNISLNKTYEKKNSNGATDDAMDRIDQSEDTSSEDDNESVSEKQEKSSSFNPLVIGIVFGIVFVFGFVILIVLSAKNKKINKL